MHVNGIISMAPKYGLVPYIILILLSISPLGRAQDVTVAPRVQGAITGEVLNRLVQEAHGRFKDLKDGKPADYIPELARVPADLFGVAIATASGAVYAAGDVDYSFTIQSVSKPFTAALVMQQYGSAKVILDKIGVEPTGQKFNSILATQTIAEVSVNPLVNSGAIAAVSLVKAESAQARFNTIKDFYEGLAASRLSVIEDVFRSEAATNQRNRAHAYILSASDRIYSDPMEAVDVYTRQCSIGITAKQLAVMGATLANGGINPISGKRMIDAQYVPKVLAIMMTAGFYNESGLWAFTAGLPAKTGVGGGVVAVVPGRMAIVGFSPRVNDAGNSVRSMKAVEHIAERLGANVFNAAN
jgi:glutaminase